MIYALTVLAIAIVVGIFIVDRRRAWKEQRLLRQALQAAAARNRELERLRQLAATLLRANDVSELQREVVHAIADLLEAEAGAVSIVVEEGRFVRIVAASGPLVPLVGSLLPVDHSLAGWVVTQDQAIVSEDLDGDPRSWRPPPGTVRLKTVAMVPLRSAGVVIGTVSVHNRRDGRPFSDSDLRLLETLGDQVVVGVDRAAVLAESRRNEQLLGAKNKELERATRLKSEFLANMSHELRTPLNAIIGFSDLLLSGNVGPLTDVQRDFLESVLRNGKHLLGLINNVLDLSKIEAGRMSLTLASVSLHDVIRAAVADTATLRSEKAQECAMRADVADALTAIADGVRVRQILFNLLANAAKFTPDRGQIALSAVRTRAPLPVPSDRATDTPRLVTRDAVWISVSDTGIGIKQDDMPKLFLEFSQVDSALNRQQQGTGLGLALCKSFVELHGGTIGAESIAGQGSTFWFILPVDGPVRRTGGRGAG